MAENRVMPKIYYKTNIDEDFKELGEIIRLSTKIPYGSFPKVECEGVMTNILPRDFQKLCMDFSMGKEKLELPERYIINENATILFWKDETKTIVKRAEDDEFNPRLAFLTAFFQHYCGMSKNKANKYLASLEVEGKKE